MDHRVSKDMISSGMTPSGEKTQADLSKTQYGSAPSPNRLMDAYHSMYQNQKEETLDEEGRNIFGSTPQLDKAEKIRKYKENVDRVLRNKKPESANDTNKNLNNSVDLLAAYRAVYEHHQKDENGNTIPHEDDVKEGKIPVDMFDTILNHYVNEGYDAEDVIEVMSSLNEEELQNLYEEPITATLLAIGGKLAAGAAAGAAKAGAIAAKGGAMAAKGGAAVGKALGKVKTIASTAPKKGLAFLAKQGSGTQGLKNVATAYKNPTMGNVSKAAGDVYQGASNLKYKSDIARSFVPKGDGDATNTISKTGRRTPVTTGESADLFDIIKGQLLDEGLSEEEIRNIMLKLTPEEIMNEMAVNPKIAAMDAKNKADMIARAKAKQVPQNVRDAAKKQYKAGTPNEDPKNPYTTDDKKTIQNYYSKDK